MASASDTRIVVDGARVLRTHTPVWKAAAGETAIDAAFRVAITKPRRDGSDASANKRHRKLTIANPAWRLLVSVAAATAMIAVFVTAVAGLYVLKSAAGIDLFAGHSVLHDLLYAG